MQGANKELRNQRDIIVKVRDDNNDIYELMTKAGQKVREMSRREFCYRIGMYAAIILLMIAIVCIIVVKIIRS